MNTAAFTAAVAADRPRVVRYATAYLGSRHDAEDVVQDALADLWRHRNDYATSDPTALIVAFTKHRIRSTYTRTARRREVPASEWLSDMQDWCNTFCDPGAAAERATDTPCMADPGVAEAVDAAINDLPEPHRHVVRLRFLEGLTENEVAARLDLAQRQVEHLAAYGLGMLRRRAAGCLRIFDTTESGSRADAATVAYVRQSTMLHKLTPRQQEVLRLRYVERLTLAETGRRLGCRPHSAGSLARCALARLREWEAGLLPGKGGGAGLSPWVALLLARPELLAAHPEREREVFRLRYLERLTVKETARRMGLTVAAVRSLADSITRRQRARLVAERAAVPAPGGAR